MKQLQELNKTIQAKMQEASALYDRLDEVDGDETTNLATQIKDLNKEIESLEVKAAELRDLSKQRGDLNDRLEKSREPIRRGANYDKPTDKPESKSWGEQTFENPEFKQWHENMVRSGNVSSAKFGQSPGVELKAVISGASDSAGDGLRSQRIPGIFETSFVELNLINLVTRLTTNSNSVDFVRELAWTNNAAGVVEATEATRAHETTGVKPESNLTLEALSSAVKTIAHILPVTRQTLADVDQLQQLIEKRGREGVMEELNSQMLTGNGGANLTGVANTTGITTQAFDTDILTTTRKARTKVRTTGRATPTAFVMDPVDWEAFDLLTDNENRYYFGGPTVLGTPRLWGLPVVEEEAATAGEAYVADWRLAYLWQRQDVTMYVTDSHSDWFARNLLALLFEGRYAFELIRPAAFVEIDLTA